MNAPARFTRYSPPGKPHITIHAEYDQGSEQWLQARCGLLTASEMKLIVTPTLKIASNDKERAHLYELLAQRITQYVEPRYISDDMLRGHEDEVRARLKYEEVTGNTVDTCGFITNDCWGFTLGYSPDGLVAHDGGIEAKSRRQKFQVQTIIENLGDDRGETIPADYVMQCQSGLLISERQWLDFLSYSGGLPMAIIRVWPDPKIQNAIVEAAGEFERRIAARLETYRAASADLAMTERVIEQEMFV
ncbi:lambda exonuclease family protein [Sphingomonas sp.]|uniref:lambda exonuclease family protein n=1 Tax=Sphingomonas sp. TaxID=28214 RepID=UPI002FD8F46B